MMWLPLSLASAVCHAAADTMSKKALEKNSAWRVSMIRASWGALFLLPFIPFGTAPVNPKAFWIPILFALPLEILASYIFQSALKITPLSICIPFMAFTPVFLLIFGWIVLHETPSHLGIVGICLTTSGAFLVRSKNRTVNTHPFATIFQRFKNEKGVWMVFASAGIYALTATFARKALAASSPLYFSGVYLLCFSLVLIPFQFDKKNWKNELISNPKLFAGIGIMEAAVFLLQFQAFLMMKIAYVIAIKRLSVLFAVLFGWIFFNEKDILSRGLGALIMVLGAILIALA